eukprot:360359-Chlamydomonas_euryale.AAC.2
MSLSLPLPPALPPPIVRVGWVGSVVGSPWQRPRRSCSWPAGGASQPQEGVQIDAGRSAKGSLKPVTCLADLGQGWSEGSLTSVGYQDDTHP